MYPIIRTALEMRAARKAPPLPLDGTHVTRVTCLPWDLDYFMELNNGRTLTLMDLGRTGLAIRTGIISALKKHGWGFTMAGVSVRYRRRVVLWDRLELHTTFLGHDDRFVYSLQSFRRGGETTSSSLGRAALVGKSGIVPPTELTTALGQPGWNRPLPDWVQSWIAADHSRPWPPEH
ncbi:acyl-CoA thioesterase [Algicella marina]|uniref:Thioeseterase n=1 Tax=Algicella marina TaxID=2683284 RepID=A0A6P1SVE7_9RHOB|nr:acyl-CoA thioesterase [Algicella marina]QHQ33747.1 thioeseterase [Algicella marina]